MPWRRTRDPYAIWLSETMLQQTRVETVIPYYERFLERFPTVQALADAETDDVMRLWAGLGYYSRARNLHAAAKRVVDEYSGELPDDVEGLRSLPGVGRYTAGAVASIAFDRQEPLVDGNVARVLTRWLGIREDVKSRPVQDRLWSVAGELARGRSPGDLNQALMELGAQICTPRNPSCGDCPVKQHCRAFADGDPEALPVKVARAAPQPVRGVCALVTRRGRVLAVRRPPKGLLGGLWELPGGDLAPRERPGAGLVRCLGERVGLEIEGVESAGRVHHVFTHRVLDLHVMRAEALSGRVRRSGFDAHRWLPDHALADLPMSRAMRKALAVAQGA